MFASLQAERDREREKEKAILLKEEAEGASKRRRLKRGDLASGDSSSNFGPPLVQAPASTLQGYDGRDRDRKGGVLPRNVYAEESAYDKSQTGRSHSKDGAKLGRREHEYPIVTYIGFLKWFGVQSVPWFSWQHCALSWSLT